MRLSCSSAICPTCVFPLIYTNNGIVPPALRPKYKQQICLKLAIIKPQNTKYQLSWQEHCSFLENKNSLTSNGGDMSASNLISSRLTLHSRQGSGNGWAMVIVMEWARWDDEHLTLKSAQLILNMFSGWNYIFLKWRKWKLYRLFKWNKQPKKKLK